jgi:copper chaperone
MFELTLPTMTCGHCVKTVTAAVMKLDPAAKLTIDLPTRKVQVDSAKDRATIEKALAEEGYAPA